MQCEPMTEIQMTFDIPVDPWVGLTAVIAVAAFVLSIFTYLYSKKEKRAEFLSSLYSEIFNDARIIKVLKQVEDQNKKLNPDDLDRVLTFMDKLYYLYQTGFLKKNELDGFRYELLLLNGSKKVTDYIEE